ncbi:MAG TPA: non-heme iron oxygenase ferredoxin subunit [Candidatus Baltobacteraceae bacterium]
MSKSVAVAKVGQVPPGTTMAVRVGRTEVMLCNVDGAVYAIEDVCTHDGGQLDQGTLEGRCIVCPRHGATFDVQTGAALTLPAVVPVATYPVRIDGDDIYVEV